MNKIHVVGVSDSLIELANIPKDILNADRLIIAARKHHAALHHFSKRTENITPIQLALDHIEAELKKSDVVVLASGDPLFYGIGTTLLRHFPAQQILFNPCVSSIQRACALLKISWDDAHLLSLHGRSCYHIPGRFLHHAKSIALTDQYNSPAKIAEHIISYLELIHAEDLIDHITMMVVENIGNVEERIFKGTLQQTRQTEFSYLNVVCCLNDKIIKQKNVFGLCEDDIKHSRGLITKDEVRAASLHRLQLPATGVLWDIGAGSGSISIEAARLAPQLTVYAIEQKDEEIDNIKANIRNFGCYNVIPVQGRASDILETLPQPERVFVGGSGGELETIIAHAAEVLPEKGRILVNSVLEKTAHDAPLFMKRLGLQVSTSTISICRNRGEVDEQHYNPITLIAGEK